MNDVIDVQARETAPAAMPSGAGAGAGASASAVSADVARAEKLKSVGWVSYLLHLVVAVAAVVPTAQASIALLVVAFVIDLVKKDDAAGTWQESHFSWRIRSVVWAAVLYVVTLPLWLLFFVPGWIAWGVISIWFLYRIVRGMVCMNDNRPVGV